jgi:predicted PurR-regulated permease PerM
MDFDKWPPTVRVALWILAVAGSVWLLGQLMSVIDYFRDIILLFFLAWLLAFTLGPIVDHLSATPIPRPLIDRLRHSNQTTWAERVAGWHISRPIATTLVYTGLVVILVTGVVFIVPIAVTQFSQLAGRLPAYGAQALQFFQRLQTENPPWLEQLNARAAQFGVNLEEAYKSFDILRSAQDLGGRLAQNTLGIAAGFASLVTDLLLVIIISFYMTLDMPRLTRWFLGLVPGQWQDECEVLFASVNRTFGGFVRSQLVMALLSALGTMIIMQLAGLGFVIVVSLFAGIIMLIPVIGAPIALFVPTLIALFQSGLSTAIAVFIAILALQQLILHIMMPRIMSQTMGMHPLLVFAALLIGVRVAGFWGALFGIPVVGVIGITLNYIYQVNVLGTSIKEIAEPTPILESDPFIVAPSMKLEDQQTKAP